MKVIVGHRYTTRAGAIAVIDREINGTFHGGVPEQKMYDLTWNSVGSFFFDGRESNLDLVHDLGPVVSEPRIASQAEMNDIDVAQLAQRFYLQYNLSALPSAAHAFRADEAITTARIFQTAWNTHLQQRRDNGKDDQCGTYEQGSDGASGEPSCERETCEEGSGSAACEPAVSEGLGGGGSSEHYPRESLPNFSDL